MRIESALRQRRRTFCVQVLAQQRRGFVLAHKRHHGRDRNLGFNMNKPASLSIWTHAVFPVIFARHCLVQGSSIGRLAQILIVMRVATFPLVSTTTDAVPLPPARLGLVQLRLDDVAAAAAATPRTVFLGATHT